MKAGNPSVAPENHSAATKSFPNTLATIDAFLASEGAHSIPKSSSTGRRLDFCWGKGSDENGTPMGVNAMVGGCADAAMDVISVGFCRMRDTSVDSVLFTISFKHFLTERAVPTDDFELTVESFLPGVLAVSIDFLQDYTPARRNLLRTRISAGEVVFQRWRTEVDLDDAQAAMIVSAVLDAKACGLSRNEIVAAADEALATRNTPRPSGP